MPLLSEDCCCASDCTETQGQGGTLILIMEGEDFGMLETERLILRRWEESADESLDVIRNVFNM